MTKDSFEKPEQINCQLHLLIVTSFNFELAIDIKVGLGFLYRISSGMKESPWHMVDVLRRRPKIYVPWQKSN